MTPGEFLTLVRTAPLHERAPALRLAVQHWRLHGVPPEAADLLRDILSHSIQGFSRHDIQFLGSLWSDAELDTLVRTLPGSTTGTEALFLDRDPEAFLRLIADVRDNVAGNARFWGSSEETPLTRALLMASIESMEPPALAAMSPWLFLFVGASRAPGRLLPLRMITQHRHDPDARFVSFAFSNPFLSHAEMQTLLGMLHPAAIAAARDAIPEHLLQEWLERTLEKGSDEELIRVLSSSLAADALARSERALRLALHSSLPPVRAHARHRLAELVTAQDVDLAAALLCSSPVPFADLPDLVAACRRNSLVLAHSRA